MTDVRNQTPVADLAVVLHACSELVAGVRPDQWRGDTPCQDWDVRALVNHLVLGHRLFSGILRGTAEATPQALDPSTSDALGDDPAAAYRDATRELLDAFGEPGVLERMFVVPVGPVPGIAAAHLRIVEELVHGWDLATATGLRFEVPDAIAEGAIGFTRAKLADVPPDASPFAAPQPVADDAPALDRLAALLGRRVE